MSSSTWTKGPCNKTQSQILSPSPKKKKKPCCFHLLFTDSIHELDSVKLLLLTVKHVGGGSSFIRTTAAGGTGKTPPGTGCKPGAVGRNTRSCIKGKSFYPFLSQCRRESSGKLQHVFSPVWWAGVLNTEFHWYVLTFTEFEGGAQADQGGLRTGKVTWLEGDHLIGVRFGVLRFTVSFILQCRHRGRHHSLWEQCCQFGTRHILQTHSRKTFHVDRDAWSV